MRTRREHGISRNTVRRYLRAEITEPAYAERRSRSAIDKYSFQLSAMLKTEAARSRKLRRTLKQIHEGLKELGFEGSYDRVAAFARVWREGQTERVNPASKRTDCQFAFTRGRGGDTNLWHQLFFSLSRRRCKCISAVSFSMRSAIAFVISVSSVFWRSNSNI